MGHARNPHPPLTDNNCRNTLPLGARMSARADVLKKLTDSRNTSVERVAEYALLESSGKEQSELAEVLMERNRRAGWVALIRSYHRLEKSVREKIMNRPRDLFGPLAETMQDSDGP